MKDLFRLVTLCAAAVLFAGLSHASTVTYDFSGDCCDDIGGPGSVMGTLVLTGYTLGDPLETSNFVSFSYSSLVIPAFSTNSLDTAPGTGGGLFGMLPVDLPGPANVTINGLVVPGCSSCPDGVSFRTETTNNDSFDLGNAADFGSELIWSVAAQNTAAPEPSSLVMLAVGLAGLVAWRQRRRSPSIN
jgi:hypothetical protein